MASRLCVCGGGEAKVALQSGLEWMGRESLEAVSLLFLLRKRMCVCVCEFEFEFESESVSWGGAGGERDGVVAKTTASAWKDGCPWVCSSCCLILELPWASGAIHIFVVTARKLSPVWH